MKKDIAAFALAGAFLLSSCDKIEKNIEEKDAREQRNRDSEEKNRQYDALKAYDADQIRYDIDTKTGYCYSVDSTIVFEETIAVHEPYSPGQVKCTPETLGQLIHPEKLNHMTVKPQ